MSQLFRIYKCTKCEYIDYIIVTSKESINHCGLCGTKVGHTPNTIYASSEDEATLKTKRLIQTKSLKHPAPKPTRSLGVKKRILRILVSLIELNKGRAIHFSDVLEECEQAGISRDKAIHFLDILSSEGCILHLSNGLRVSEGVDV